MRAEMVLENSLWLQGEAITGLVTGIFKDGHYQLRALIGINGLFPHKKMRVTRVAGAFDLFQFLGLLDGTEIWLG